MRFSDLKKYLDLGLMSPPTFYLFGFFAIGFFVIFGISKLSIPNYGKGTGIRPLEKKIDFLRAYINQNKISEIDYLILGSSIGDYGFRAETFAELEARRTGQPVTSFNFSTGGAEPTTFPWLYQLARNLVKVKHVLLLLPPQVKRPERESFSPHSPDFFFSQSPMGMAIESPWQFPLFSKIIYSNFLRSSPGLRDLLIFQGFSNFKSEGTDVYQLNQRGDRAIFSVVLSESLPRVSSLRETYKKFILDLGDDGINAYLNRTDLNSLEFLMAAVRADGGKVTIVGVGPSASFVGEPIASPDFVRKRNSYLDVISQHLKVPVVSALNSFAVPITAVSDETHLNYYGAMLFTEAVHAAIWGPGARTWVSREMLTNAPTLNEIDSNSKKFNIFASLICRSSRDVGSKLIVSFVDEPYATIPLPKGNIELLIRDRHGMDHIFPAEKLEREMISVEIEKSIIDIDSCAVVSVNENIRGESIPLRASIGSYKWAN